MKVLKNSTSVAVQFRVNAIQKTENDEAELYYDFVNTLAREMVFFSVERFGFVTEESDDCIMGVVFSKELFESLIGKMQMLKN